MHEMKVLWVRCSRATAWLQRKTGPLRQESSSAHLQMPARSWTTMYERNVASVVLQGAWCLAQAALLKSNAAWRNEILIT